MKRLLLVLILNLLVSQVAFSQDSTWFKDITIEVGLQGLNHPYVQAADINGDFYPDILVGTSGIISGHSNTFLLFLNVPDSTSPNKRKFINYTEESGINVSRIPGKPMREYDMALFADVDNDGDLDLVSSIYYHRLENVKDAASQDKSEVFLNDGKGHFTLKEDSGLADHIYHPDLPAGLVDAVGLSFLDYDYDGILDLYIATRFKDYAKNIVFPDILMKGNGDGSFTEVTDASVQDIIEPLYGVNVTDFDNDGWQDVITSPYCRTGGRILKNLGDGSFIDIAQQVGYNAQYYNGNRILYQGQLVYRALCQWEAPVADYDNDGDMDILQCLIHGGYDTHGEVREGRTLIAQNQGPPDYNFKYNLDLIHRVADKQTETGDFGGLWIDFQNDGWQDIVICQGYYYPSTDRVYMCVQKDDRQFYDVSKELGLMHLKDASNAQGCDFDLDGDMDLFVFHNSPDGSKLRLLRNDIANKSNWISVKLIVPAGCNQDGIGARVRVYTDTIAQIREIQTGMGHFGGQEPFILNFGFGEINGVDSIEVRWPKKGSPVTKVYNPAWNTHLVVNEDGLREYINLSGKPVAITKFSPSRTDAGTVNVGETNIQEITIINSGNELLNIKSLKLSDTINYSFSEKHSTYTLAPSESLNVAIEFAPTARDLFKCKLIVETGFVQSDTASNGRIIAHDISGQGYKQEPLISVKNKTIAFDSTKTYQDKVLQVKNSGELDLIINSISVIDDVNQVFTILELSDKELLPYTIKGDSTLNLTVRFAPPTKGNYDGKILIKSNAYKDTNFVVNLTGIGDAPKPIAKYPVLLFLNFGNVPVGQYKDTTITVENIGDGDLKIISASVEYNTDNVYSFFGMEFPLTVKPSTRRDINIRFEPKEQINYNRVVHIYSNAENMPDKSYSIRGKGVEPAFISESTNNSDLEVTVKPNPVTDKFEIILNPIVMINQIKVAMYDINGKVVKNIYEGLIPVDNKINSEIGNLPAGAYYIIVKYKDKQISVPVNKL